MGKNSDIEWTHHTFNPWWGCAKVSPACQYCYAEAWAKRVGSAVWGKKAPRRFFSEHHWQEPLKWNAEAKRLNTRFRVFCASMADVFEDRKDLKAEREKLWRLIEDTPELDWLLLTKRPENIGAFVPWKTEWPRNIWLGTTVESQEWALKRLPHLLQHAAAVRFLSCEPLLGPIDLSPWTNKRGFQPINWVIAGGESGPKARPMHPDWARKLRDFCAKKDIAFHFKQGGHWIPAHMHEAANRDSQLVEIAGSKPVEMVALGKKDAGRLLDGRTFDEFPLLAG